MNPLLEFDRVLPMFVRPSVSPVPLFSKSGHEILIFHVKISPVPLFSKSGHEILILDLRLPSEQVP